MDVYNSFSYHISGSIIKMEMDGNVKAVQQQNSLTTASAKFSVLSMGQTITAEYYYRDNVAYVNTMGQKFKQEMSAQKMADEFGMMDTSDFSESDFSRATTSQADGIITITVSMPASALEEAIGGALPESSGDVAMKNYSFSDMTMTMHIDGNGNFVDIHITTTIRVTMSSEGEEVDVSMDLEMIEKFNNIGQPVTITPPDDLAAYVDIEETQPSQAA